MSTQDRKSTELDRSNFEHRLKIMAEDEAAHEEYGWFRYQVDCSGFACYPEANTGSVHAITYNVLQLAAESGEIAGKLAKHDYRKDPGTQREFDDKMKKELGDLLWSIAQICTEKGWTLQEVAMDNTDKLKSRQARGVLKGSGDNR